MLKYRFVCQSCDRSSTERLGDRSTDSDRLPSDLTRYMLGDRLRRKGDESTGYEDDWVKCDRNQLARRSPLLPLTP